MNIRDPRTVGEQVKSGLRLAGWVLLMIAFVFLLLGSAAFLLGKGDHTQSIYRILGACGLLAISAAMFVSVRRWVKWFFGALAYCAVRAAVFGFFASGPSAGRMRAYYLEVLVLLAFAAVLCARYLSHVPRKIEAAGLVALAVAISFSMVCDSGLPMLSGLALLGLIQLAHGSAWKESSG